MRFTCLVSRHLPLIFHYCYTLLIDSICSHTDYPIVAITPTFRYAIRQTTPPSQPISIYEYIQTDIKVLKSELMKSKGVADCKIVLNAQRESYYFSGFLVIVCDLSRRRYLTYTSQMFILIYCS